MDTRNAHNAARKAAVYSVGSSQDEWVLNQAIMAVEKLLYDTQAEWNRDLAANAPYKLIGLGEVANYFDKKDMNISAINLKDYLPKGYNIKYKHNDLMQANQQIALAVDQVNQAYEANGAAALMNTINNFYSQGLPIADLITDAKDFIGRIKTRNT